jgi:hypothetical protein
MSLIVPNQSTIDEAWAAALEMLSDQKGGEAVNLMLTVTGPGQPNRADVEALINAVPPVARKSKKTGTKVIPKKRKVSTVANTLFPKSLYRDPGFDFAPSLPAEAKAILATEADAFYGRYLEMLPDLMTEPANNRGTYFGRMVAWPGNDVDGGVNQLAKRIASLRGAHERRLKAYSASDLTLEFQDDDAVSIQEYAATDDRTEGFPCLVHIAMTVLDGRLSMTAIYRNWYLVTRGYGNLVGLSRLLQFVAQQTGYQVGELVVVGVKANAEHHGYTKTAVRQLIADASAALAVRNSGPVS